MSIIKRLIAQKGTLAALSEKLDVSASFLCQIASGHRPCPVELAWKIERIYGGEFTAANIRPDIFKPEFTE